MSHPVQEPLDWETWGLELHWVDPGRIDFERVPHQPALPESPRLQAYRQAVALCDEDEWEQGLSLYEEVLTNLTPDEILLAQLACWGRSSALQQLGRYAESWAGLTTLFSPGRRWRTPLAVLLNWLQTAVVVAGQSHQGQTASTLLQLWFALSRRYPPLGLQQRFDELLSEAYEALASEDIETAVDWLDETRLDWEVDGRVLPSVRLLLVDGLVELLEFEGALEEAEEVVTWAARQGDVEVEAEWAERVEDLRNQARDPYNLARCDDRSGLEKLGKVNQLGPSGRNALMGAAVTNNLDLAAWLLERNANPNLIASDGWNPLLLAADHDHVDMITLLAQSGADLGATNDLDQTCLHVAAWQDFQDTARRLIELGIEADYCDSSGNTALHLAACEAVPGMIELLVTVLPVDVRNDCNESTPLMLAAESDLVDNLELLLRLGADLDARDLRGRRALDYAQSHQAEEATRFLQSVKRRD